MQICVNVIFKIVTIIKSLMRKKAYVVGLAFQTHVVNLQIKSKDMLK